MGSLAGKVAVICGGTSGIGRRSAELFVEEGAQVVIVGRRQREGEAAAKALGAAARFVRADVSVERDIAAVIAETSKRFGRLDCLFNNAGVPSQRAGIVDIDLQRFDRAMAIHLNGTMAAMKHAAPLMVQQGSGSIINTASINGIRAGMGGLEYAVAKAAVIHLTRCVAVELGEKGVRVNCISPGPIATGIFGKGAGLDHSLAEQTVDAATAALARVLPRWQPLPHVGLAVDIARVALFLAGDGARLINGHNLVVDGGISVGWPAAVMREDRALFEKSFQAEMADADT